MTERVESDISMKKYLLGELGEPEQQELEQRLITSNEYFEELLVAEDELVDEYLHGKLSPREQDKFNSHFLCTPERREKLRFSRSLQRYVSTHAERPQKAWAWPVGFFSFLRASYAIRGWSMATALAMMALGGSWLTVRNQFLQHGLEEARQGRVTPAVGQQELHRQLAESQERNHQFASQLAQREKQSAALEQELAELKTPASRQHLSSVVALALMPSGVRDAQANQRMQKLTIPVGANWVELRIDLGRGDYQRYQTVLQKVEGEEVSTQITPKMKTRDDTDLVVLAVPAKLLTPGDYVLSLSGMDANGSFEAVSKHPFRVVQK